MNGASLKRSFTNKEDTIMFSMKPKNELRSNDSITFDALLKEAIKKRKEVEALRRPAKLSASAFLRKALEIASIPESRLNEIEKVIMSGPQFENTRTFIRKAIDYITSDTCSTPSYKLSRLSFLMKPNEFNGVIGELAALSVSPFAAFAAAARQAIEKHPDCFGEVEDLTKHQAELKDAEVSLQNLFRRIETEWGPEDIDMTPAGDDLFRVTFKASKGAVSVGARKAGEALMNHLMNII